MNSDLEITSTPSAGNGVFAKAALAADTLLLVTPPPAFSVIYAKYRKEVCTFCWTYCQGRTLKVKDKASSLYFCRDECLKAWETREGEEGLELWRTLLGKVKPRKHASMSSHGTELEVEVTEASAAEAWSKAEDKGQVIRSLRTRSGSSRTRKEVAYLNNALSIPINADVLSFLAAGVLYLYRHAQVGTGVIPLNRLCSEDVPYINTADLVQHVDAYIHLLVTLPFQMLPFVTVDNIYLIVSTAYNNVFSIRSIDHSNALNDILVLEDPGSEILGKALVPIASFFNHSCSPNVIKARDGSTWIFRALHDVSKNEELYITYLGGDEKSMSPGERREVLRLGWGFECGCSRCVTR